MGPEHQIAEILAARTPEGRLLYSEHDVVACFAILTKGQRETPEHLPPQTNTYLSRLMTWAGVGEHDTPQAAAEKLDRYFEANPVPSTLLQKLAMVLQTDVPKDFSKLLGTELGTFKAPGKAGSVLGFMISQRTAAPGDTHEAHHSKPRRNLAARRKHQRKGNGKSTQRDAARGRDQAADR